MSSHSTQNIKHFRKSLLFMSVFPLLVIAMVGSIFYISNNKNVSIQAQSSYRPPYDPVAIFNTPIPANYPTDSRSSSIISKWTSVMGNNSGIFFSIDGEVPPLNKSTNSDPLYSFSAGISGTFRVNPGAVTGSGSDHPTIILNTDTKQELRIWQATINHGSKTISGSNGSLFYYNNDGTIKNPNGTRSLSIPYSGGGAGNGLSYHAGMITREDWDSGVIRHALRIAYNNCSFNGNAYRVPATKSDQPNGCTSAGGTVGMDMGMILQLNSSVDCNTRTSPTGKANDNKFVRMVCQAMKDYGIMISDGTGSSAVFYMEANGTSGFSNILTTSNGHLGQHFRNPSGTNGVPWNQFRVVSKPASNTSWGAGTPVTPTPPPPAPAPNPTPPPPAPAPNPSPNPAPSGQTPYKSAITLPGRVEAEDFDNGGQNISYYDTDSGNSGGVYRTTDVDIESSQEGGYNVGWGRAGEWLEYTTNSQGGKYNIDFRVASAADGAKLTLKYDNQTLGTVDVPNTGGWYNWRNVTLSNVSIPSGSNKVLRVEISGASVNINYLNTNLITTPNTGGGSSSGGGTSGSSGGTTVITSTPKPGVTVPVTKPPTPLARVIIPGSDSSSAVPIPEGTYNNEDGQLIGDFDGDGLNDIAFDLNGDGIIDKETEIVVNGRDDPSLTDKSAQPVIATVKPVKNGNTVTIKVGPLPEVKIAKPVAYTFVVAQGVLVAGFASYLAITKLAILAPFRRKLGL